MRSCAFVLGLMLSMVACGDRDASERLVSRQEEPFKFQTEQFADLRVLRYRVPGFEQLTSRQKELLYYLYQAALSGRDIIWDQNYRHNLRVRRTLENIVKTYTGDRSTPEWREFVIYTKRVWFSNGVHHHYSSIKILPAFTPEYFRTLVSNSDPSAFPMKKGESIEDLLDLLTPVIFDPALDAKKVNLDPGVDQIRTSATNFYSEDLTQPEVESFFKALLRPGDPRPVSVGLNSQLVKANGKLDERVWRIGGMYAPAIEKIVFWLSKAVETAETAEQASALEMLIDFYTTGDLRKFDEYSILWLKTETASVDTVNGFIEVYNDPLGYKGSFEAVVSFRDPEATKRIAALGGSAQWFEDHSPTLDAHKKPHVTGISAKVITVVVESGDASPSTPIGINLPNANWIREQYGSKSVSLENIVDAYNESDKVGGVLQEFSYSDEEIARGREYGTLADKLHTDMHEVVGHASGQLEPGIGTPHSTLKSYASTLEEGRADLVALYYLMDPKLVELGVMPSLEVGKTGYDDYIRNALLVQLARLKPGENLEQAHMRNRHLVASWAYEKGAAEGVIEKKSRDGKTYYVIKDYARLRQLFGELLRETQRITSQGDYEAGRVLVETYGVRIDPEVHAEVLERYAKLNRAPYAGFINPVLIPDSDASGAITDVRIEYPEDFMEQMLYYAENYSFLPTYN